MNKELYAKLYAKNAWGYENQPYRLTSGKGSTKDNASVFNMLLGSYLDANDFKTVLDVGCGVWEYENSVYNKVKYIGIDCVDEVIEHNKSLYENGSIDRTFVCDDVLNYQVDVRADLCILRNVLQHLSNTSIKKILEKALDLGKYVLCVDDAHANHVYEDIMDGAWRALSNTSGVMSGYPNKLIISIENKQYVVLAKTSNELNEFRTTRNTKSFESDEMLPTVLIAILAKNKAHVLPRYLSCIERQNYPKSKIEIYINTNNNVDDTENILRSWVEKVGPEYRGVEMITHTMKELENENSMPHAWNGTRVRALGLIRNSSLQKTFEKNCDFYFVVDCDNFILPHTLRALIEEDRPIIAPMLKSVPEKGDYYSNYFADVEPSGYLASIKSYYVLYEDQFRGTFQVPVVHCTYLINRNYIDKLNYFNGSNTYEFVIFSASARSMGVSQWICNKSMFGCLLHFSKDEMTLEEEVERYKEWINEISVSKI